jgi:hypothetical protein
MMQTAPLTQASTRRTRASWRAAAVVLSVGLALAACTATPKYSALGDAGVAYGGALDAALQVTAEKQIDLNSERLAQANQMLFGAGGAAPATTATQALRSQLAEANQLSEETLARIAALRAHVSAFRDYFVALQVLATSSAPCPEC